MRCRIRGPGGENGGTGDSADRDAASARLVRCSENEPEPAAPAPPPFPPHTSRKGAEGISSAQKYAIIFFHSQIPSSTRPEFTRNVSGLRSKPELAILLPSELKRTCMPWTISVSLERRPEAAKRCRDKRSETHGSPRRSGIRSLPFCLRRAYESASRHVPLVPLLRLRWSQDARARQAFRAAPTGRSGSDRTSRQSHPIPSGAVRTRCT